MMKQGLQPNVVSSHHSRIKSDILYPLGNIPGPAGTSAMIKKEQSKVTKVLENNFMEVTDKELRGSFIGKSINSSQITSLNANKGSFLNNSST